MSIDDISVVVHGWTGNYTHSRKEPGQSEWKSESVTTP